MLWQSVKKELSRIRAVNYMAKAACQRLRFLSWAASYLTPRTPTITESNYLLWFAPKRNMQSSIWIEAPPTSIFKLDAIQRTAMRTHYRCLWRQWKFSPNLTAEPEKSCASHHLILLDVRFYSMHFLLDRLTEWNWILTCHCHHELAAKITKSNVVSHHSSILSPALEYQAPSPPTRIDWASKGEVNRYSYFF